MGKIVYLDEWKQQPVKITWRSPCQELSKPTSSVKESGAKLSPRPKNALNA